MKSSKFIQKKFRKSKIEEKLISFPENPRIDGRLGLGRSDRGAASAANHGQAVQVSHAATKTRRSDRTCPESHRYRTGELRKKI